MQSGSRRGCIGGRGVRLASWWKGQGMAAGSSFSALEAERGWEGKACALAILAEYSCTRAPCAGRSWERETPFPITHSAQSSSACSKLGPGPLRSPLPAQEPRAGLWGQASLFSCAP